MHVLDNRIKSLRKRVLHAVDRSIDQNCHVKQLEISKYRTPDILRLDSRNVSSSHQKQYPHVAPLSSLRELPALKEYRCHDVLA